VRRPRGINIAEHRLSQFIQETTHMDKILPTRAETGFDPEGERVRRHLLGDEAFEASMAAMTPFDREYQVFVTNQIFGRTWARGILSHTQLSLLNLGMLAGKGCMEEFELHFRVALKVTGVTLIQLREVLLHIGMYCGIPVAREAFVIARRVLKEEGIDPAVLDQEDAA
jgi:alkylhydroperoxidase/carboxymuconolactone decarboxylase family protein YurZ